MEMGSKLSVCENGRHNGRSSVSGWLPSMVSDAYLMVSF